MHRTIHICHTAIFESFSGPEGICRMTYGARIPSKVECGIGYKRKTLDPLSFIS